MKTTDNQEELFVVVDESDNIIGYKSRAECHSDKSLIHRSVGVVLYNSKGEILIQKRSMSKDMYPGYYTVSASGHVNRGESYKQAAERELREELGIKVNLTFVTKQLLRMPLETEFDALFTGISDGPFKLNKDEVKSVEFLSPSLVKNYLEKLTPYTIERFKTLNIL